MKTTVFDFNRIGLLFQRYFTERFNTEVIYWSIMLIAFMIIRNGVPLMVLLIVISGAFYAGRFFREIHSRSNGVAYFMIPATQVEKMTVAIVMTSFYYFLMMLLAYIIGNLLGTLFNNMLASVNFLGMNIFRYSPLQWKLFEATITNTNVIFNSSGTPSYETNYSSLFVIIRSFLLSQSVFLLGSTYFKSNQTLKTFLSIVVIQILISIVLLIEVKLLGFNDVQNVQFDINSSFYEWGKTAGIILRTLLYLLIPFFWVVSYFRLTEKQI